MRDFYTKENMQGQAFHVPDAGLYFEPAELVFETETDTVCISSRRNWSSRQRLTPDVRV